MKKELKMKWKILSALLLIFIVLNTAFLVKAEGNNAGGSGRTVKDISSTQSRRPYVPDISECSASGEVFDCPHQFPAGVRYKFSVHGASSADHYTDLVEGDGRWEFVAWSIGENGDKQPQMQIGVNRALTKSATYPLWIWFRLYTWNATNSQWVNTGVFDHIEKTFEVEGIRITPTPTPTPRPTQSGSSGSSSPIYRIGSAFVKSGAVYTVRKTNAVEYTMPISKSLTSATVPSTITVGTKKYKVTSIGQDAFSNNRKLLTVKIGKYVTTISAYAFMSCPELRNVTMGDNVTTIGAKAFCKCTSLQKITLPKKLKKIGAQAFYGNKKLKQMTFKGTAILTVGKKAFTGIPAGAKINVPNTSISKYKKMFQNAGLNKKVKVY